MILIIRNRAEKQIIDEIVTLPLFEGNFAGCQCGCDRQSKPHWRFSNKIEQLSKLKSVPRRLSAPPTRLKAPASHSERHKTHRWRAWYNSAEWKRLRLEVLKRAGWKCEQTGVLLIGKRHAPNSPVVDHITPHRGDRDLFFDINNLQAVAKHWHDSEKQKQERAGQY